MTSTHDFVLVNSYLYLQAFTLLAVSWMPLSFRGRASIRARVDTEFNRLLL